MAATLSAVLGGLWIGAGTQGGAQPVGAAGLPGARAEIRAAEFPSLQAALDALPPEGGVVLLPAGEFPLDQPLILRTGDVLVRGAGSATHIKNVNTQQAPALILEHPEGATSRKTELWRIQLSNFRITGNPQSGHGIEARRINELFIHGVTVSEHGGDGIRLHFCYEDPRISDSLITYNKQTGIHLIGCHDIVVSANQLEENGDALRCIDGFNLAMSGNNLDDHLGDGVVIENTYGSVVAANMIEECQGHAIVLDRDCYGITLSANVIAHNGGGVDLRDAHGCAVSANTFTLMRTQALRIGSGSGRIAVSGNSFCDSFIGENRIRREADDAYAGGVVLDGTRDVAISGNTFSSVQPRAIRVLDTQRQPSRVLVSENVFVDVPANDDLQQLPKSRIQDNLDAEPIDGSE
jgi:parallel beta-helix repeat protein